MKTTAQGSGSVAQQAVQADVAPPAGPLLNAGVGPLTE